MGAQVQPALFVLLPLLVLVAAWFARTWTLLSGLVSLIVACGGVALLAQIARYLGRRAGDRLGAEAGPEHTANILSHADETLPMGSKLRCHDYFRRHSFTIPTADEEKANPDAAREQYLTALSWLREKTRPRARDSLLLNENIAYGFRRNLLGLKPVALVLLVLAFAIDLGLTYVHRDSIDGKVEIGLILAGAFILVGLAWLFLVRKPFVVDASESYALRLLAQCEDDLSDAAPAEGEDGQSGGSAPGGAG